MTVPRRGLLQAGLSLAVDLIAAPSWAAGPPRFRAIAFDAFPVFDPRPIATLAEMLFAGLGPELISLWRTRQFEYTWLRTAAGSYTDFMRVTEDSLVYAAKALKVELRGEQRDRLLASYLELRTWPDATPVLHNLRAAGIRLAFLSNFTPSMLHGSIKTSNLDGVFEHIISTDQARMYKPAPQAYQLGVSASFQESRFSSWPSPVGTQLAPRRSVIRPSGSIAWACRRRNSVYSPTARVRP